MSVVKLRDLKRFKKSRSGLIDFACILEQASPKIREKIISEVGKIDPAFLREALRKVVFFEELIYLDESVLAELLSHLAPKVLAYAISKSDKAFVDKITSTLSLKHRRLLQDELDSFSRKPAGSLVLGAQLQILKIARELENKNKFVFELSDCPRFKTKEKQHLRLVRSK